MVPEGGLEAFDDLAPPERVVLSCRHHDRDHEQFVQAFGASFHVNEAGVHEYEGEGVQPFAIGDEPAPGVKAIANGPIAPDDTVLRIDVEGGALLFADSLLSSGGALGFMPDGLLGEDPEIRSSAKVTAPCADSWTSNEAPAERAFPAAAATVSGVGLPTVAPERFRS